MFKVVLVFTLMSLGPVSYSRSQISEPFEGIPFHIIRNSVYAKLPDSLGGKFRGGLCVITIDIGKSGIVGDFYIQKLSIKKGKRNFIEWSTGNYLSFNQYPDSVKKYYSFLKQYVAGLKLTRDKSINVKEKNFESFVVRFS